MTIGPASRCLNPALSQQDRAATAPRPEALAIDGRSLAQLLAFGAHYGCLIRFYDLTDTPHGDWSLFFGDDPAVAAAMEAALDLPEIATALRALLAEARAMASGYQRHVVRAQLVIHGLIVIADAQPLDDDADFDGFLTAQVRRMRRDGLALPLHNLHHHRHRRGGDEDWRRRDIELLEALAEALLTELTGRAAAAQARLERQLDQRGHAPQAALWIAFVQLYAKARGALNRFPRRLLEFYYRDVLRQNHRDAVPAQTYLAFGLAKGVTEASVPKGTRFLAGTDSAGRTIGYAVRESLAVTPAVVTGLSVHRVSSDDTGQTGVLVGTADPDDPASFPVFGGDQPGSFGAISMQASGLGFSLSSDVLMLAGGQRDVVVTLASAALPGTATAVVAPVEGQWFAMQYSTAGGWMQVEALQFAAAGLGTGQETLQLTFRLPPVAPPLVAVTTKPAPGAPTPDQPANAFPGLTDAPTLIVQLLAPSTGAAGAPSVYQVLSQIRIATISINVAVAGLLPEKLASSGGAIDPAQNFPIFGITPVQSSSLAISATELFVKVPTSLELVIDWAGRPMNSTGFAGWYSDYTVNLDGGNPGLPLFDNTTFRAGLAPAQPGPWTTAQSQPLFLFQTDGSSTAADGAGPAAVAPLCAQSVLALSGIAPADPPPLYADPAANTLQLVLAAPAYAFGNTLYARNLMAASAANAETIRNSKGNTPTTLMANAGDAIAAAPDAAFPATTQKTLSSTVAGLQTHAFTAFHSAISASAADGDTQGHSLDALKAALTGVTPPGLWQRLRGNIPAIDPAGVTGGLSNWLESWRDRLTPPSGNRALQVGERLLQTASALGDVWAAASGDPVPIARGLIGTALQSGQKTVQTATATTVLPNPPWLPMASAVQINYAAGERSDAVDAATLGTNGTLIHLNAFGQAVPAKAPPDSAVAGIWLLPEVSGAAALYIDLSHAVDAVTLLFVLEAGPDGWSTGRSDLTWQKQSGGHWLPVELVGDTTDGLRNTGIVRLQVANAQPGDSGPASRLRAVLDARCTNSACIKSVTTNVTIADWVGPGGADGLGTQMPAGTIAKSERAIPGIGSIQQPMAGFGGTPPNVGVAFDAWMAEQLRHKGRAIACHDYARIALAAIPALWQLAVIPATDEATGRPAPGRVWLAAVAGPQTPNIADPTTPEVDAATLQNIGRIVGTIASPFARLQVTNPPWTRISVTATLTFTDDDTAFAWEARLQDELVRWLSPWPDPQLPPRDAAYWTRQAIAEFIRNRPYVQAIVHLSLHHDRDPGQGWHYFTSARAHELCAFTPPVDARTPASAS
ncbi:hypothetical protein [Novosphingobium sp. FSW06-99]|uniref:hypothetical protein n=1 Tax=Novosphingobium sp. FSW06-99 TaxID=1739113 RepID=UPI00076CF6FB|nr:hypothetical protein [Novosphingobium sp. FSW06-99]KUR72074.1 hypothetical protein AQZ49_20520 [Novosphingobium sp. FSW06-99]